MLLEVDDTPSPPSTPRTRSSASSAADSLLSGRSSFGSGSQSVATSFSSSANSVTSVLGQIAIDAAASSSASAGGWEDAELPPFLCDASLLADAEAKEKYDKLESIRASANDAALWAKEQQEALKTAREKEAAATTAFAQKAAQRAIEQVSAELSTVLPQLKEFQRQYKVLKAGLEQYIRAQREHQVTPRTHSACAGVTISYCRDASIPAHYCRFSSSSASLFIISTLGFCGAVPAGSADTGSQACPRSGVREVNGGAASESQQDEAGG